ETDVRRPAQFFTAQGWPPLAARALLVRYWESHGHPRAISLLPGASSYRARIALRGADTVTVASRKNILRRYEVDGVVWGRETLWLDEHDRFAAIVTRVHILPLEGIRADLKDALPALQRSAIADRMSDLAAMSRTQKPIASGTFALRGATVIDGTGRPAISDATVIVRDGRIERVGPTADIALPKGLRIIDVRGKTIIPGLWDMHAHAAQIEWAPAYLAAGVTTIRDMGGEEQFLVAFRSSLGAANAAGPRVLLAGLVDGRDDGAFGTTIAGTPDEGRAVVDHYRDAHFDQIKLYSVLAPDVVTAIVERAHRDSLTVTGHVPRSLGVVRSIDAGMDHIAHIPVSGDTASTEARDVIRRLAEHHVVVDPTIPWNELLGRAPTTPIEQFEPGILRAPPALAANYRSVFNNTTPDAVKELLRRQLAILRAMHNAGVTLVAGTDGGLPGYSLLRSIELFVEAGYTPMEAIQSATLFAAQAMGRSRESGTIEAGKRADLVLLDANPLDDIANIRTTRYVVAHGRIFESAALWRAAGFTH
ncbi:MAG: amidohydrolase family protein, partial [Gemmatimonadaceae bacterium]